MHRKTLPQPTEPDNQTPELENINLYLDDSMLRFYVAQSKAGWGHHRLINFGSTLGSEAWIKRGFLANQSPPSYRPVSRQGERIEQIEFHPAYHELMQLACNYGLHALPWAETKPGAHCLRVALYYLYAQTEAGSGCPVTMTFAAAPVLKKHADGHWHRKLLNYRYDPTNQPATNKTAITIGMAMTEKQGGTDLRANTTSAQQLDENLYQLNGHKWFCSAPMCDAFLTLAQTSDGLSCFLLPRWRGDGQLNGIYIQRLKDKMGNRSNASAEIQLADAQAELLGKPGSGIATIMEMVALTRFDCMIGSAALMRQAISQVLHHITRRKVFDRKLAEHALMQNVAADLALETEAALAITMHMAQALDAVDDPAQQAFIRLAAAVGKYWICKRTPAVIGEAQECLGGNGYIEESILPRLYREAPVNAIWEGSSNVQCLDILRALHKAPESAQAFLGELQQATGHLPAYDNSLEQLTKQLTAQPGTEYNARRLANQMAVVWQAAALLRFQSPLAEAFCSARLSHPAGPTFGCLPPLQNHMDILQRLQLKTS